MQYIVVHGRGSGGRGCGLDCISRAIRFRLRRWLFCGLVVVDRGGRLIGGLGRQ